MNRNVAIGCASAFVLFAVVVVGAYFAIPKLVKKGAAAFSEVMAEQTRLAEVEAQWRPPGAAPDAAWFPEAFGDWRRVSVDATTGIPRLNIDRPTQHAVYQSAERTVEVDILAANDLEKDALVQRVQKALESGSSSRMTTNLGNRVHVRLNGNDHTRLWWVQGWMFVFRAKGADDPLGFAEGGEVIGNQ
jgi:hypothetical protein